MDLANACASGCGDGCASSRTESGSGMWPASSPPSPSSTVSTVIVKGTKVCNAGCTYCSTPPEDAQKWSQDDFEAIFSKLAPLLTEQCILIWHGGEPMLMGPDFYRRAFDFARKIKPEIRFSLQSNLLGYESRTWRGVFEDVFKGSVSTSYDPDEKNRLLRGNAGLYAKVFFDRLEAVLADGFHPKVISTFDEESVHLADSMYERALAAKDRHFNLRLNYRYPAGRAGGRGELLAPRSYGDMLVRIYDRWISDVPPFVVTPLDEMLKKSITIESHRCPWTRECGGRVLSVEPDGGVFNCADFADLGDPAHRFGSIWTDDAAALMGSPAAKAVRRRRVDLPRECQACRHFERCEGGCVRDAVLYGKGMGGKFHYCESWLMVFDRIAETVADGRADGAVRMYGGGPDGLRASMGAQAGGWRGA